jgi:hypothetical protein
MVVSDDKVVNFTGQTTADIDISHMVDNINWDELEDALILAIDKEGSIRAYSSASDAALMVFMLEKFKSNLLNGVYN